MVKELVNDTQLDSQSMHNGVSCKVRRFFFFFNSDRHQMSTPMSPSLSYSWTSFTVLTTIFLLSCGRNRLRLRSHDWVKRCEMLPERTRSGSTGVLNSDLTCYYKAYTCYIVTSLTFSESLLNPIVDTNLISQVGMERVSPTLMNSSVTNSWSIRIYMVE